LTEPFMDILGDDDSITHRDCRAFLEILALDA
jgi:hypothetical protein